MDRPLRRLTKRVVSYGATFPAGRAVLQVSAGAWFLGLLQLGVSFFLFVFSLRQAGAAVTPSTFKHGQHPTAGAAATLYIPPTMHYPPLNPSTLTQGRWLQYAGGKPGLKFSVCPGPAYAYPGQVVGPSPLAAERAGAAVVLPRVVHDAVMACIE